MKNILTIISILIMLNATAQKVENLAIKTYKNDQERTAILNCVRKATTKEFKQDFVFEVKILNVCKNYAWFTGSASRRDRKEIQFFDNGEIPYDCCHVEALMQKVNGVWYMIETASFSTDMWYEGIWDRHKAPIAVFGSSYYKN